MFEILEVDARIDRRLAVLVKVNVDTMIRLVRPI